MRAVVTGRSGQLARALSEGVGTWPGMELIHLARPEFDLARPNAVAAEIARLKPDAVVNTAAYTAVDKAEDEEELAFSINADAAGALAAGAAELGIPIIQISTDYVFDGKARRPYRESDPVGPVTAYGRSKLEGERKVAANNPAHFILRTAWVYSPFGSNFVKTILARAAEFGELKVVSDQLGNPTSALDLAEAVLTVLGAIRDGEDKLECGTYHVAGAEEVSWYDFACEMLSQAQVLGGPSASIAAVSSEAFPTKAVRPANSRLDSAKFAARFGYTCAGYREALGKVLPRLISSVG